jgi:endonuclease/exonuclease/phosphatase family metal-dependent hydrolase
MRVSRILFALVFLFTAISHGAESKRLKVAFWNIEWFPGGHPNPSQAEEKSQIAQVVPEIKDINPDIIGLMEVRNWAAAETAVSGVPNLRVEVCSDFLDDSGSKTLQQQVIASQLPAVGGWWEHWKAAAIHPKRGFSFAAIQATPGHIVLVYSLHLKSNRGEASENFPMREEAMRQLLDHAAAMEKAYASLGQITVIVGGDFNTSVDDPKFSSEKTIKEIMNAGYTWCWTNKPFADRVTLPTKPSTNPNYPPWPDACFDHAFVKGAKIISASAPNTSPEASDHRPVVLEIELP